MGIVGIEVGEKAPDFELVDQDGMPVKLSDFRGEKNVLLVFYTLAFTNVCESEMCSIRDELGDLDAGDTRVLAVSVDSRHALREWANQRKFKHTMLADFWPHGAVATSYGVFDADQGMAVRGTFVIDKSGVVRWKVVNAIPDARSIDEYRAALAQL